MSLHIALVLGSVRENREGIKAAKFFQKELEKRNHTVTLIDPEKEQIPLLKKTYAAYKDKAPKNLEKLNTIFQEADAVMVISAEYNHSIPPALSNTLDHFMKAYFFKPSAIVTYSAGSFGGVRAAMQLRALLPEIGMPTIPSTYPIPKIQDTFDEKGNLLPEVDKERTEKRIKKFLDELEFYANALKAARKKGVPY